MKLPFKYQAAIVTAFALFMLSSFSQSPTAAAIMRRLQQTEEINHYLVHGEQKLRVAVFGSSNAWGAGLSDRFKAYPYKLSPEVDNYADFSAGPNYPGVCTETLVGDDEMYDVIVLDFWLKSYQGLIPLATRLRQRFPNAIMIFLKLWTPNHSERRAIKSSNETSEEDVTQTQSLLEWKQSLDSDSFDYETVKAALASDVDGEWSFPQHAEADAILDEAVSSVGGYTFQFPMRDTAIETIIDYLGYFDESSHSHVSSTGHAVVASSIHNIVVAALDSLETVSFVNSALHGTWGRGDSCHLWFTTGATANEYDHDNMEMVEYDDLHGKFALELNPAEVGWVDVTNPQEDERTLYLSFLASDEGVYPIVNATYNATGSVEMFTLLEPTTSEDENQVHVVKTVPLNGMFGVGTTRIYLETIHKEDLPFRLVGDSFTDETNVPSLYGFGPEFNI
mmetsp:Transcript_28681/g.40544  ORF Transcript_28681/g.40544 Transcript_28681/m.40544 type:complete len:450 (+) Transcript_28681:39-1388(+)